MSILIAAKPLVCEKIRFSFPAPYLPDKFGRDINAHPKFTMSPIETRVGTIIHGPKACGIESFGLIEGDFEGPADTVAETFRMRHAMGKVS